MSPVNSTQRFSSRVDTYVRFRPSYPKQIIEILERDCGLARDSVIADIASGTGIFTRLLLEHGNRVFGVEPNAEMRRAGEEFLAKYPMFTSVNGTAEATTLPNKSVDLITSAQAAHWFDREKAVREFQRILKDSGYLVLIWNDRQVKASAFNQDYEYLVVKYGTDYTEVQRLGRAIDGNEFFSSFSCQKRVLPNHQLLSYDALEGRLLSSSYAPQRGEPSCPPMTDELRRIFGTHQRDGLVRMDYDTNLYFGRLSR